MTDQPAEEPIEETIRLDQFMKLHGLCSTGGQAKLLIQDGMVEVNHQVETRRRRRLHRGDLVTIDGTTIEVQ